MKILFLWAFLFWIAPGLMAQNTVSVRLLDQDNSLPVAGALFEYGNQTGSSDLNGMISFMVMEGEQMRFSHVSYGSWEWSPEMIQQYIEAGVAYRQLETTVLYPVTIVGARGDDFSGIEVRMRDRLQHDGASLLTQYPGINAIRKGGNYGFDPVFRGFKYDQLNIVLNGAQSATAACPNRMDPPTSQMAPNMIDRVEVLKGPYSLRYGTGFGATINFIPTSLRFTSQPHLYGRVAGSYEGNGNIYRSEAKIGYSLNNINLAVFGSWAEGDDYAAGDGSVIQSDFERGSFGANLGIRLNASQQLRLSTHYNRARDSDFPALPMDLRRDDTWMLNLRHDIQFINRTLQSWNTTVFGSWVDHRMDNLLKPLDPRTMNAETEATTQNIGGRTEGIWEIKNARLYAGADYRLEAAEGTRIRTMLMGPMAGMVMTDNAWQDGSIQKAGVFAEYHLRYDALKLVFSGRVEHNTADINDPTAEFLNVYQETAITQINPSFSAGIQRGIGDNLTASLSLGRAQRSGSLTERFINYFPVGQDPFELLGDPGLLPEVNNQVDLSFTAGNKQSSFRIDLFGSYMQNFISSVIDPALTPRLPMSPGVRRFTNIENAYKTGFEVYWQQTLFAGMQQHVSLAYTYAQDLERDEPLPEIAPVDFRYVLNGRYLNETLEPELSFRYVGRQGRISNEFGETVTPSFNLLDVVLKYFVTPKVYVQGGIHNALDVVYYEHLNRSVRGTNEPIYAPGRNIFVGLNIDF